MTTTDDLRGFLKTLDGKSSHTYANALKSMKVFFRDYMKRPDLVQSFSFPEKDYNVKVLPDKERLKTFYNALPTLRSRTLFLLYASSGLRRDEILGLTKNEVDLEKRMIIPNSHNGRTKRCWVSFFNDEAELILLEYLAGSTSDRIFPFSGHAVKLDFDKAKAETGIRVTPQILREWFCNEMGELGVADRYIDAFCGRVPKSILARHYTEYSPDKLKRIYDRAGLKVLS